MQNMQSITATLRARLDELKEIKNPSPAQIQEFRKSTIMLTAINSGDEAQALNLLKSMPYLTIDAGGNVEPALEGLGKKAKRKKRKAKLKKLANKLRPKNLKKKVGPKALLKKFGPKALKQKFGPKAIKAAKKKGIKLKDFIKQGIKSTFKKTPVPKQAAPSPAQQHYEEPEYNEEITDDEIPIDETAHQDDIQQEPDYQDESPAKETVEPDYQEQPAEAAAEDTGNEEFMDDEEYEEEYEEVMEGLAALGTDYAAIADSVSQAASFVGSMINKKKKEPAAPGSKKAEMIKYMTSRAQAWKANPSIAKAELNQWSAAFDANNGAPPFQQYNPQPNIPGMPPASASVSKSWDWKKDWWKPAIPVTLVVAGFAAKKMKLI